jgi:hypothetical protein
MNENKTINSRKRKWKQTMNWNWKKKDNQKNNKWRRTNKTKKIRKKIEGNGQELGSKEKTSIDSWKQTCKTGKFRITKKITKKNGKNNCKNGGAENSKERIRSKYIGKITWVR